MLKLIKGHDRLRAELPADIVPIRHVTKEDVVADEIGRKPLVPRGRDRHQFRMCLESRFDQGQPAGAIIGERNSGRRVTDLLAVEDFTRPGGIGPDDEPAIDAAAVEAGERYQPQRDETARRSAKGVAGVWTGRSANWLRVGRFPGS